MTEALQWAAGWNNAVSLVNIETNTPSFQGIPFTVHTHPPDEGIVRMRGDKTDGAFGFVTITWIADGMSDQQYQYIRSTFTPGGVGLSAKMTIRTMTGYPSGTVAYANYSVVLHLPKRATLQDRPRAYVDIPLIFTVEAAL